MRASIAATAALAAACFVVLLVTRLPSIHLTSADSLDQTQLFIVPEANVLTGTGQKQAPVAKQSASVPHVKRKIGSVKPAVKSENEESKHWTKAMLKVQQQVMKQILKQRKQRESAAAKRAELSYRDRLSSSLSYENRRMRKLASREKAAQNQDLLQTVEDHANTRQHAVSMRQKIADRISEIKTERIDEQADGDQVLHRYKIVGSQGLHHLGHAAADDDGSSGTTPRWLRTDV
jgi:hypothetical protein